MTEQAVFAAATALVLVAIAMVSVGVGLVFSLGWALVVGGVLLAAFAVLGTAALLHESGAGS